MASFVGAGLGHGRSRSGDGGHIAVRKNQLTVTITAQTGCRLAENPRLRRSGLQHGQGWHEQAAASAILLSTVGIGPALP